MTKKVARKVKATAKKVNGRRSKVASQLKPSVKVTSKKTKSVVKTAVKKNNKAVKAIKDNLRLIPGVGPKMEKIFNKAGIKTYRDLERTSNIKLNGLFDKAGSRFNHLKAMDIKKNAKLALKGKI